MSGGWKGLSPMGVFCFCSDLTPSRLPAGHPSPAGEGTKDNYFFDIEKLPGGAMVIN
jgi:hypothetical protein